jgi:hypothetical protein
MHSQKILTRRANRAVERVKRSDSNFSSIFLNNSSCLRHAPNFPLDALLDVLLDTHSPLNLERVPLKLVSALRKLMEYWW